VPTLFNNPILSKKCFDYLPDYKDIQRIAKINVPKGTEIGSRTSLASQQLQECAKICVKKCKRAKNWKIDFADVCIFFFGRQSYLQIFAYFASPHRPSESL